MSLLGVSLNNNKAFVFVHGYNVNRDQARGWESEMFKRMYWAGSKARFYGVNWAGDRDQKDLTAIGAGKKTHRCVNDAFASAQAFAQFINSTEFSSREVTVAAHSLGNLVVASAEHDYQANIKNYFMVNAALSVEAVLDKANAEGGQNITMIPIAWRDYPTRTYASEWYKLAWPQGDSRSGLTWRGRLADHTSHRVNFYSDVSVGFGDQVMRTPPADDDDAAVLQLTAAVGAFLGADVSGRYSFCLQERLKGRFELAATGSKIGGWNFNLSDWHIEVPDPYGGSAFGRMPADQVTDTSVPSAALMAKPFFSPYPNYTSMIGTGGSAYCSWSDSGNLLLSEAIPAKTLALGGNRVLSMDNMNMQALENGWPQEERGDQAWLHSDLREVAYLYVYPLFDNWVLLGNLK